MYAAHNGWIQSEIEAAKDFCKPIIAVAPRGERFPDAVMHAAHEKVGWSRPEAVALVGATLFPASRHFPARCFERPSSETADEA